MGQVIGSGIQAANIALRAWTKAVQVLHTPISTANFPPFILDFSTYLLNTSQDTVVSDLNLIYESVSSTALLAQNVTVCLSLSSDIEPTLAPSVYDFASLETGSTRSLTPLFVNANLVDGQLCGSFAQLSYSDSFVPILRVPDPNANQPLFSDWELGIIYTTSALYFIVLMFFLYRLIVLIYIGEFFSMQAVFHLCLSVFDTFRGVYFALLGSEQLVDLSSAGNFALIDIPYFFFFIGMTLLMWWWVSIVYTRNRENAVRNFRLVTLSTSAMFAILLTIVGILYQVLEQNNVVLCLGRVELTPTGPFHQEILLIVYKSVLCLLALLGGLLFLLTGKKLHKMGAKSIERQVNLVTWIAFFSFFWQSLYFIILAVTHWSDSVFSLIPLWPIEILPQVLMLYFQRATSTVRARSSRHNSTSGSQTESGSSIALVDLTSLPDPSAPSELVYTGQDEQ